MSGTRIVHRNFLYQRPDLLQNQIVAIGDSITNRNMIEGVNLNYFYSDGYWSWAQILLQGQLNLIADLGVSGETTAQILARFGQALSYNTKWIAVLAGTNDITGGVAYSTIINNLKSMYNQALALERKVLAMTIMPNTGINTGSERTNLSRVNQWIKDYAKAHENIIVADLYAAWADPATGDPISGVSDDGIHPNCVGAPLLGQAIYQSLAPYFPSISPFLQGVTLDPFNLAYNGTADGNNASGTNGYVNATGFTGQGPNGWTNTRTGTSTGVCSKVSSGDWRQRTGARCAVTIGGGAEEAGFLIRTDVTAWGTGVSKTRGQSYIQPAVETGYWYVADTNGTTHAATEPTWPTQLGDTVTDNTVTWRCVEKISPGDTVYAQCEFATSSLVGTGMVDLSLALMDNAFSNIWITAALTKGSYTTFPSYIPASGVLRTREIVVPSTFTVGTSGPTIRFQVKPKFTGAAGATVNLDIFSVELKKIKTL